MQAPEQMHVAILAMHRSCRGHKARNALALLGVLLLELGFPVKGKGSVQRQHPHACSACRGERAEQAGAAVARTKQGRHPYATAVKTGMCRTLATAPGRPLLALPAVWC